MAALQLTEVFRDLADKQMQPHLDKWKAAGELL
jgi:hypothetical protein